ncbi:MAG: hypothetical protein ACK4WB_00385 [Desulfatiglandales bacterium]
MEGLVFMYLVQNVLTVLFVMGVCGFLVYEAYFSRTEGSADKGLPRRQVGEKAPKYI